MQTNDKTYSDVILCENLPIILSLKLASQNEVEITEFKLSQ